jgi:hypothetical protein
MSMPSLTTLNPHSARSATGPAPGNKIVDQSGRFDRLQRPFQKQLKALADDYYKAHQEPLVLTDTVRTDAEQAQAHRAKPFLALPAGHPNAMHPKGLAVDVDFQEASQITPQMLARHGLHRPALSKGETWHIEPVGKGGSSESFPSQDLAQSISFSGGHSSARLSFIATKAALRTPQSGARSSVKPQGTAAGGTTADQARLKKTAVETEAMFLEKLLGQMRTSMVDPVSTDSKKLRGYTSMADQHLARSLAAGGGIGLARRIIKDLAPPNSTHHKENRHDGTAPAPGESGAPPGTEPV